MIKKAFIFADKRLLGYIFKVNKNLFPHFTTLKIQDTKKRNNTHYIK